MQSIQSLAFAVSPHPFNVNRKLTQVAFPQTLAFIALEGISVRSQCAWGIWKLEERKMAVAAGHQGAELITMFAGSGLAHSSVYHFWAGPGLCQAESNTLTSMPRCWGATKHNSSKVPLCLFKCSPPALPQPLAYHPLPCA